VSSAVACVWLPPASAVSAPSSCAGSAPTPRIFEAFYREHVEDLQRFVARRVGARERPADLTAEIFLAAIDSAHHYRPRRGTPKAWLYGIARVLVANDHRRRGRERAREAGEEWLRGSALLDPEDAARIDARTESLGSGGIAATRPLRSRIPAQVPPRYGGALEARRGVVDTEHSKMEGFRFPDTSSLPTEPEELRLAATATEAPS
jgi:hypothetical protein